MNLKTFNWEQVYDEIEILLHDQKRRFPHNQIEYYVLRDSEWCPLKYEMGHEPYKIKNLRENHKNIKMMIKLYLRIRDEPSKAGFLAYLRSKICDDEFRGLDYFLLEFLIKIRRIDQVFVYWEIFNNDQSLRKLHSLICLEPTYFSLEDLDNIKTRIKRELDSSTHLTTINAARKLIYDLIMAIKRNSLYQQLEERANPEINFDIERVREELDYFNFPESLKMLLLEVESLHERAVTEEEYSDVAEKVRKLLDQLIRYVSDRVSLLKGEKMAKGKEPKPVRRRQFLREKELITLEEQELLDKIYGFVSAEGPHSLKSSAERTRICKNIAIEVILYLLRRLHEFEKEVSAK